MKREAAAVTGRGKSIAEQWKASPEPPRGMIGRAANPILFTDREGRIIWANDALMRLLDYAPGDLSGHMLFERMRGPLTASESEQMMRESMRAGMPCMVENVVYSKRGDPIWIELFSDPMADESGLISQFIILINDISGRKQQEAALRRSEERLRSVMNATTDGIITIDEAGVIEMMNPAAERMFGYDPGEMAGIPLTSLMPDEHREAYVGLITVFLTAPEARVPGRRLELVGRRRDGSCFPFDVSVEETTIEGRRVLTGIVRDITDQKAAEEKLARTNESLEASVEALRRSNGALEEYARVASHDLKEPLRKIRTFGDMLSRKLGGSLSPENAGYLSRMTSAAARMDNLIDGLLAYSRVSRPGPGKRPTDLGAVARDVVSDLEARVAETGGRIEIGPLPTICADPLLMRQLFQNLIGNSLKFHRKDVPPVLGIHSKRSADDISEDAASWTLTFVDNGVGFDNKYAERIFTVFERLEGASAYEGSGVGLAICRRLVEEHGGTIRAESAPGEGATFIVTLPG